MVCYIQGPGGTFVNVCVTTAYASPGDMVSVLLVIAADVSMLLLKLKP